MALLNYTTTISAEKTLAEIQRELAAAGCKGVMVAYAQDRAPEAIIFTFATVYSERSFRLPANPAAVHLALERQSARGKVPRRLANREQATRVAWRICKDWLEAQLAIVESGMVSVDEVFFPYMLDRSGATTVHQAYRDQQLQLSAPGK